jgi:CHASE3 domain sensor protein
MFVVAALVLSAVVVFSYRELQQFKRANAEAARTRDAVDSIDQLLSSVTDAATGQRAPLPTGEGRYLLRSSQTSLAR